METRMNAVTLAKRLKSRMATLKKERIAALKKYDVDFETWKKDVAKWLKTEPQKAIPRVKKSDLENSRYGCHTALPNFVFEGIPKSPARPSDESIREIQKTLRYISFTETKTIEVTQRKLDEWLGKDDDGEE